MDSLGNQLHLFNCLGQLTAAVGGATTLPQTGSRTSAMTAAQISGLDAKGFKQLVDTQTLVDCTLACDGGKISAHKVVLAACSSYLARILAEHPVEHPIIILPELNIEDVRTLIHYMYTGELLRPTAAGSGVPGGQLQPSNSISLLRTAAILSINSLSDLLASTQALAAATATSSSQAQQFTPFGQLPAASDTSSPPTTNLAEHLSPLLAAIKQHQQQQQQQQQIQMNGSFQILNELHATKSLYDNAAATAAAAAAAGLLWAPAGINLGLAGLNAAAANLNSSSSLISQAAGLSPQAASGQLSSASSAVSLSSMSSASPPLSLCQPTQQGANGTLATSGIQQQQQQTNEQPPPPLPHNGKTRAQSGANSGNNNSEFQFKCPVCQNHFQTICSFEYHMQRIHNVTSFGCEICHKPFASLRYVLTDHMRRCHGWKGGASATSATKESKQQQQQHRSIHQTS